MAKEKSKLIIITALAVILIISIFLNLHSYAPKKKIEQELGFLEEEKAALTKRIEESAEDNKQFQEKINALESDLKRLNEEREGFQKQKTESERQYAAVLKDRDELLGQLKERAAPAQKQELNDLPGEKQDLEQQLAQHRKMVDDLSANFVQESSIRFQLQDKFNVLKGENRALKRRLNKISSVKAKADKKLAQLNEEKASLERRFTEMELFLKEKIYGLKPQSGQQAKAAAASAEAQGEKKEAIELPPIIVLSQAGKQALQGRGTEDSKSGAILAVNRENNFVIVGLGEDTGLKMGDTLHIYRGNQDIATIEVIQLRQSISACDIKKQITPIEAGDIVR